MRSLSSLEVLPTVYPSGHSRIFEDAGDLDFYPEPIGIGGSGQVYKAKLHTGSIYSVKLFKPYTEQDREWHRNIMLDRGYDLPDDGLDVCFNLWHRESRVYEHLDRCLKGPSRSLFLTYCGTAMLPHSSCPPRWRQKFRNHGDVPIIVLELLETTRPPSTLSLTLNDDVLAEAKEISQLTDHNYAHIYIHLRELVDHLHRNKIIHRDIKPENISNSVLFDFSRSWVSLAGLPCVDELYQIRKSRTFEERVNGEVNIVRRLILRDYAGDQALKRKFRDLADCHRCK